MRTGPKSARHFLDQVLEPIRGTSHSLWVRRDLKQRMKLVECSTKARIRVRNTSHRDAWNSELIALAGDFADAFAHERGMIDAAFARNHEVGLAQMPIEVRLLCEQIKTRL